MKTNQAFLDAPEDEASAIALQYDNPGRTALVRSLTYSALELRAKVGAVPAVLPVVHGDMHPGLYGLMALCWTAFLGIFWLTFAASAQTLFMISICTVYGIMFFGVPFVISRQAPAKTARGLGLLDFLRGKVDTIYGPVNGFEALAQMILVPVALSLGGVAIAFIIHANRIAH